jgi:tetratricopeptide (TPR) repeat protein
MKKLLLVGWDGADWKVIKPLMEEGMMPNTKGLVDEGVMGNITTLNPMFSPMLWTSIATGKRPFKHGIHGFSEPVRGASAVRPITNLSRSTRAIWNITTLLGLRSSVVGWWPSHPAEPIKGVMVSDLFHKAVGPNTDPWPVPPAAIHPPEIADDLAKVRQHPQDLDPGLIKLFLPNLADMDQEKERRISQMAKTIGECTTMVNAADTIMSIEPWTLSCVYLDAIDHFSHGFMNFNPPRLDWVDEKDYENYHEVIRSAYIYHDILLGRLLKHADDDTFVILMSDHGFHPDHLRPRSLPDEPAGPAEQHRPLGIFVIKGPGIKQDELVHGATLLDVCPTALTCLGLPIGEDMDGNVLTDIFEEEPEIEMVPSWDDVEGEDGSHSKDLVLDPVDAQESLRQLVELGYIEELPEDNVQAVDQCVRELRYNLARSYIDAALHVEALPILTELHERWPEEFRFGVLRVQCYLALDRPDEAAALIDVVAEHKQQDIIKSREELKTFLEENKEKMEKAQAGDPDALEERDQHKLRKLRARSGWNPMALGYLRGVIAAAQKDYPKALQFLEQSEKVAGDDIRVLLKLGDVYVKVKDYKSAHRVYDKALELDSENADAWRGIALSLLEEQQKGNNKDALEAAQRSVGLRFQNPMGHYALGIAKHRSGKPFEAVESLQVAIDQNPNFPEAYKRLAYIYEKRLLSPDKAQELRQESSEARARIKELRTETKAPEIEESELLRAEMPENGEPLFPFVQDETVVVVSGLPRSGTSMMMQILRDGGLNIMTDNERNADEDNPLGYFESEKVKSLHRDNKWLGDAKGKAIKVISSLLPALRGDLKYKVIFMWRDIEEVLRSQQAMLKHSGHKGEREFRALADTNAKQLRALCAGLEKSKNIDVCFCSYPDAVEHPNQAAELVNAFLGGVLDEESMVGAVRPDLHRQKKQPVT